MQVQVQVKQVRGARVQLEEAVEGVRIQRPAVSVSGRHTLFSVPS